MLSVADKLQLEAVALHDEKLRADVRIYRLMLLCYGFLLL